jgi:hypothetical protein
LSAVLSHVVSSSHVCHPIQGLHVGTRPDSHPETPLSSMLHLQIRPDDLTSLEGLSTFQFLPSANLSRLDTYHLLEAILRLKITHRLCLLGPWIPDHYIVQIVSNNFKNLLSTFTNSYWVSRTFGRCIDPVGFSSYRDGGVGFCLCGGSNLINVFAVVEAGDGDLADILLVVSIIDRIQSSCCHDLLPRYLYVP